jgi:hypothetical protein
MNGKISFGVDLIAILEGVSGLTSTTPLERFLPIAIPIMKALLVEWGLSLDETEQATKLWAAGVDAEQIDFEQCLQRVVDHLKENEEARQRLITHLVTIAHLDLAYNDSQKNYVNAIGQQLDMRFSEIQEYVGKGASFAYYLNQFGKGYIEYVK